MLFLPDDGFQPDLQLGEEFLADSLFSPDDCVLSDVSLSDALDRRDFNLDRSLDRRDLNLDRRDLNLDRRDLNLDRRDFNEKRDFSLNEKHYTEDKQYGGMEKEYVGEKQNYGNNLSCSSLHSDGDSYPNSPINGKNEKLQQKNNM